MMLSNNQKILVAQLNQIKDKPTECYEIGFTNSKTSEIVRILEQERYLTISEDDQTIVLDDVEFTKLATENGIIDETGTITSTGTELAGKVIEENYKTLLKLMRHVSF